MRICPGPPCRVSTRKCQEEYAWWTALHGPCRTSTRFVPASSRALDESDFERRLFESMELIATAAQHDPNQPGSVFEDQGSHVTSTSDRSESCHGSRSIRETDGKCAIQPREQESRPFYAERDGLPAYVALHAVTVKRNRDGKPPQLGLSF